jgi:hypothetical protein
VYHGGSAKDSAGHHRAPGVSNGHKWVIAGTRLFASSVANGGESLNSRPVAQRDLHVLGALLALAEVGCGGPEPLSHDTVPVDSFAYRTSGNTASITQRAVSLGRG